MWGWRETKNKCIVRSFTTRSTFYFSITLPLDSWPSPHSGFVPLIKASSSSSLPPGSWPIPRVYDSIQRIIIIIIVNPSLSLEQDNVIPRDEPSPKHHLLPTVGSPPGAVFNFSAWVLTYSRRNFDFRYCFRAFSCSFFLTVSCWLFVATPILARRRHPASRMTEIYRIGKQQRKEKLWWHQPACWNRVKAKLSYSYKECMTRWIFMSELQSDTKGLEILFSGGKCWGRSE